jgi:GTP cyclohydrolase FolE2
MAHFGRFTVAAENFESIHNHSACAEITGAGAALIDRARLPTPFTE